MTVEQTPRRKWNWTRIILILSLGGNLLVAGLVAGAIIGDRHRPDRHGSGFTGGMRPYIAALPDSQRGNVRAHMEKYRDADKSSRDSMREATGAIRAAIAGNPYESEALRQAFARQRAIYDGLAANGHNAIADILDGMTDAERSEFIDNLANYRRKGSWGRATGKPDRN